jgi:hypothetical protein
MGKQDYSEHPAVKAMKPYVPRALILGQPPKISRALLSNMAFFDAFKAEHGWTVGQAIQRGLVTLSDEPPAAPQTPAEGV